MSWSSSDSGRCNAKRATVRKGSAARGTSRQSQCSRARRGALLSLAPARCVVCVGWQDARQLLHDTHGVVDLAGVRGQSAVRLSLSKVALSALGYSVDAKEPAPTEGLCALVPCMSSAFNRQHTDQSQPIAYNSHARPRLPWPCPTLSYLA